MGHIKLGENMKTYRIEVSSQTRRGFQRHYDFCINCEKDAYTVESYFLKRYTGFKIHVKELEVTTIDVDFVEEPLPF